MAFDSFDLQKTTLPIEGHHRVESIFVGHCVFEVGIFFSDLRPIAVVEKFLAQPVIGHAVNLRVKDALNPPHVVAMMMAGKTGDHFGFPAVQLGLLQN